MYNKEKHWTTYQTGPFLVHFYALIYNNLYVKYGSNLFEFFELKRYTLYIFFSLLVGPGLLGCPHVESNCTKESENPDIMTLDTLMH